MDLALPGGSDICNEEVSDGTLWRWIHDRRLAIASRAAAAVLGGYVLATVSAVSLSLLVPLPKVHAVLSGLLLSFIAYTAAILWAFSTRSAGRAWIGVLAPTIVCAAVNASMRVLG